MTAACPEERSARDAWVLARRGPRPQHDPWRPQGFFVEDERAASGEAVPVATVLLTNRECPWRCVMCDLWQGTLTTRVPGGALPAQLDFALARLPAARQLKLYNSGSFFDAGAVPPEEWPALSDRAGRFERVIVESHPALVGDACLRWRDRLAASAAALSRPAPRLEVALGLEAADDGILEKLNKGMSLGQFARAVGFLTRHDIDARAFVLVQPPFLPEADAFDCAARSMAFAFDCGVSVVSFIPTRPGNGALEALAAQGEFQPPRLARLEAVVEHGVRLGRGRVFGDLWNLEALAECYHCFPCRRDRLRRLNLSQEVPPAVACAHCGDLPGGTDPSRVVRPPFPNGEEAGIAASNRLEILVNPLD